MTISICTNVYLYLILPRHCPMSMVAMNDTNKHYQTQLFNAQNTLKCLVLGFASFTNHYCYEETGNN